ncbi:hypothetical protein CFP56_011902 [Quercus suber]|uniref:Uncharacterized protein n=1 Tax=Quercus suber TaxID=58331 RepID=A0AAW0KW71_QUESU
MLRWSLKNNLIPCYDLLKSLLFENEKVITALGCSRRALLSNGTKTMVPNIALLREVGAPPSTISYLVTRSPSVAFIKPSKRLRKWDFDPSKFAFVQAIEVVLSIKKPTWEYKFEVFRRWGWFKEDTLLAFRRFPNFMLLSDEKITKVMNFVVNKLGRPSTDILMNPVVLNLSLEKRIIPRCSVVQILLAKNLIKSDFGLATFLLRKEKFFLEKFVIKFQDNVPQLLSVYQTKMDLLDVEIQSEKYLSYRTKKPQRHMDGLKGSKWTEQKKRRLPWGNCILLRRTKKSSTNEGTAAVEAEVGAPTGIVAMKSALTGDVDDDDDISGDEDMSFGSAEDDDEPEETPKKVESSKKRPSESATKTLVPAKKAKAATP